MMMMMMMTSKKQQQNEAKALLRDHCPLCATQCLNLIQRMTLGYPRNDTVWFWG